MLSSDGLGPLRLGEDPASLDPSTSIVESERGTCEDVGLVLWMAVYPDRPLGNGVRAFEVGYLDKGGVDEIAVFSPKIGTGTGLHLGDGLSEVLDAYPTAQYASSGRGRDRYTVQGEPGTLYFDIGAGEVEEQVDELVSMGVVTSGRPIGSPTVHPPGACWEIAPPE